MILAVPVNVPDAATVNSYAELLTDKPILMVGLSMGFLLGCVVILAVQHLGWLPDKNSAKIARLEQKLENREDENKDLLEELRPYREYIESRMDDFLNKTNNKE